MIKMFRRHLGAFTRSGPLWLQGWYWKDRIGTWRSQRGPRRSVSRSKVVREVRGAGAVLGLGGWLWAASALAGLAYLVRGVSLWTALVLMGTAYAALRTGMVWTRRTMVWVFTVECECGQEMEGS